jgi:hypothetical protein
MPPDTGPVVSSDPTAGKVNEELAGVAEARSSRRLPAPRWRLRAWLAFKRGSRHRRPIRNQHLEDQTRHSRMNAPGTSSDARARASIACGPDDAVFPKCPLHMALNFWLRKFRKAIHHQRFDPLFSRVGRYRRPVATMLAAAGGWPPARRPMLVTRVLSADSRNRTWSENEHLKNGIREKQLRCA